MAVVVHFSTPLQAHTGGVSELEVDADSVRSLVAELEHRFPGIAEHLWATGAVAIDGEIVPDPIYQKLPDGAEIHFVSAPSGG